ncbi:MAG: hypothetical protein SFY81_07885 [Verrucomicrobiota bacterium]|nr:hypothetical protein [Verrucomicrobiota bacterium]
MRCLPWVVALLLAVGCASSNSQKEAEIRPRTIKVEVAPDPAAIRPANPLSGRIVSVNNKLRFVVIDFANSRLPEIDQKLSVYRNGQKLSEIRITGPFRSTTVAADILVGEPRFGDDVRLD